MLEWYKAKVHSFFSAQVQGGGVQGEAFLFEKVARSTVGGPSKEGGGGGGRAAALGGSFEGGVRKAPPTFGARTSGRQENQGHQQGHGSGGGTRGGCAEEGRKVCRARRGEGAGGQRGAGVEEEEEEEEGGSEEPLTLVTGCSSEYFPQLKNLIGSLHAHEPGTSALVYDLGLTSNQRQAVRGWRNVQLARFPFEKHPPHVRTLANYAWKMLLVLEAASQASNLLYLDTGIELRSDLSKLRRILSHEGYFFTTQGCNMGDHPEVPCDVHESCTVGDKTPPGVIKRLFGVERDADYPHLFSSCIAGGMIGVNQDTRGGRDVIVRVLEPASRCALDLYCIYPEGAVAIINSNFDMAPLGLLLHAARIKFWGGRRWNAALYSALHTPEAQVALHQVTLYTRRRFGGRAGTPFEGYLQINRSYSGGEDEERRWGGDVVSHSREETGLLYDMPASISRERRVAGQQDAIYPMTFGDADDDEEEGGGACFHEQPGRGAGEDVYVSIVVSARNDDHEGNFMTRFQVISLASR